MKTFEPVKIRIMNTRRKNHIRIMTFAVFGRSISENARQLISNKFLSLCQLGMDDYTACKLVILSHSGHKESRAKIEQFIDQKDLGHEAMLKT